MDIPSQKTTKVLVFSLTYLPFIGGAEIALKEITDHLENFEFHLITAKISPDLASEEKIGNIHIRRLGHGGKLDKYLYPLRAYSLAHKLHSQYNYNLIWAMLETWGGIAALFFKFRFPKIKYLLTMQSGDSDWFIRLRTWFWWPLYKMVYTRSDHIQVISSWLANRARKYGYKKEISIVPNGVDLEKFKTPTAPARFNARRAGEQNSKLKIKEELSIKPEDKIILTDSRLVVKNGVADLIKSFHLLVTSYKLPVTLFILGSGPLEKQLKQLATQLGVQDKIIFLGTVPYEKIEDYYQVADVFVRPSLTEGFGNVFVQAMAAGLPVVATPVGGIIDFLKEGETGWLCQVKKPESIAEKIKYILDERNQAEVERVVVGAQKMVAEKYSWDSVSDQMKAIFNSLINT
ncbi:glycosyltransferase family 4 protein [Candidatus Kuenenbacteria bacterium]|nr:glycosyltransferase family 4 protein [Candidatus Kuenenbacteria bacterium]